MVQKRCNLLVFAILIILDCGSSGNNNEQNNVVVSVGKGALTLEQLNKAIPESFQSKISQEQINNFIQQWIEMELVYREALRLGMDKDKNLLVELENSKREILVRNYLEQYLSPSEEVTETEALEYYNENKDSYLLNNDEIRALHILVATAEVANDAYRRIRNGEDFETVAREVSIDYTENGRIVLDYFSKQDIVPEIASSVFNCKVGSFTRPLQSQFGHHIFKVIDLKQKGSYRDFEDVKEEIYARLKSMKRNEKYKELIIELRNKTDIKRNIELIKEFYKDSTFQQENQMRSISD